MARGEPAWLPEDPEGSFTLVISAGPGTGKELLYSTMAKCLKQKRMIEQERAFRRKLKELRCVSNQDLTKELDASISDASYVMRIRVWKKSRNSLTLFLNTDTSFPTKKACERALSNQRKRLTKQKAFESDGPFEVDRFYCAAAGSDLATTGDDADANEDQDGF